MAIGLVLLSACAPSAKNSTNRCKPTRSRSSSFTLSGANRYLPNYFTSNGSYTEALTNAFIVVGFQ